ncbi:hypothetical protein FPQ18DRAFT_53484 [Pyronema domesticum]|nr:hypothetical protein FPQ18DRAFT_53484 [Pyronema domesticum]
MGYIYCWASVGALLGLSLHSSHHHHHMHTLTTVTSQNISNFFRSIMFNFIPIFSAQSHGNPETSNIIWPTLNFIVLIEALEQENAAPRQKIAKHLVNFVNQEHQQDKKKTGCDFI